MSYLVHCDGDVNLNADYEKVEEIKIKLESMFSYCVYCDLDIDEDTGEDYITLEVHISNSSADEDVIAALEGYFDVTDSGTIYCRGEDGDLWRYVFEGGSWWLENAVITYDRACN